MPGNNKYDKKQLRVKKIDSIEFKIFLNMMI